MHSAVRPRWTDCVSTVSKVESGGVPSDGTQVWQKMRGGARREKRVGVKGRERGVKDMQ